MVQYRSSDKSRRRYENDVTKLSVDQRNELKAAWRALTNGKKYWGKLKPRKLRPKPLTYWEKIDAAIARAKAVST